MFSNVSVVIISRDLSLLGALDVMSVLFSMYVAQWLDETNKFYKHLQFFGIGIRVWS